MTPEPTASDTVPPPFPQELLGRDSRIPRWRWWTHLLVIGIYPLLGIPQFSHRITHGPALSDNVSGLLIVCGAQLVLFLIFFGVAWFASRASRDQLFFRWRPGWWVVPLGMVYSVAIRVVLCLLALAVVFF